MEGNIEGPSPTKSPLEKGPLTASGRKYSGAGIKTSVTGTVYQIELLMLLMNRGLRADCIFNLATEVASAGAFDDLVFEYKTATTNGVIFLQAKHRTNLNNKIREIDLTNICNDDFSVPKYFESYLKIISHSKEFEGDMKHFVIYTPINVDDDILHNFEEVSPSHEFAKNGFLNFDPKVLPRVPTILKIRKDSPLYMELFKLLEKNLERSIVAEKLGKTIASNNAIIVEEVFKKHRDWLFEKVLDGDIVTTISNKAYIRFQESFLKITETEDVEVFEFKEVFMQSYDKTLRKERKKRINGNDNNNEVSKGEKIQNVIDILTEEKAKFQVAKTFLTSKYKKLKTDVSTKEEINSFFEKFMFATNQPNNEELKKIIQKEIGEMMKLVLDESEWLESRIQSCILDWLKIKEGRYLTKEDCKAFFVYVEQEFARRGQTYSSLANVSHLQNCGYTFRRYGHIMGTIRNFLSSDSDVQILCVCYTNRLLTKIKLWQSRPFNQDFIFGELRTLTQQVGSEMCPIKAFTSQSNNHIFLEIDKCSDLSKEDKGLLQKIMEIVKNETKKRLVVMVAKDQQTSCKDILKDCTAVLDLENNFSDLSEESKEKLLNTAAIRFRGTKFILHTLLETTLMDHLSGDTLCELINDTLHLESPPADVLDESVKKYFIERQFSRCDILYEKILHQPDFHIVYDNMYSANPVLQKVGSDLNECLDDTIITGKLNLLVFTTSSDKFAKVCEKYKFRNVHWLVKEVRCCVWLKSQGSLSEIQKYRNLQVPLYMTPEDVTLKYNNSDKIIIVNAAPGMGKSTVLSYLETNINLYHPEYFCIRTNLVEHCQFFEDLDEDEMTKESIKFLYKTSSLATKDYKGDICKHITVLENGTLKLNASSRATFDELLKISIFCHVYNEGNIILLLDAFDEISPLYNEKVIRIIQTLKVMNVFKITITSRPYDVASELEEKLSSFSYILRPLSFEEQKDLLFHYWTVKLKDNEICMNHVIKFLSVLKRSLFKHFQRSDEDHLSTFMSIPLHVFMLATVEEKRFQEFLTKEIVYLGDEYTEFSIYTMYNEFCKIKLNDILYPETDVRVPKNNLILRDKMKKTMIDNGKLALLELFGDLAEALVSDCTTLKQEVMIGNEKTGFVHIADGKPRFVHKTYAEFFAAHFLADAILNSNEYKTEAKQFVYKIITEHRNKSTVVFVFFNYIVVSNSKFYSIFNSALNGNLQKIIESLADVKDDLGRTPFHLLFCSGSVYDREVLTYIFENYAGAMRVPDDLFKWAPIHYAMVCHDCDKVLLSWRPKSIIKPSDLQFRDINGKTPLILAMQGQCKKKCIFYYNYDLSLEIDVQDKTGKTALHYAVINDFHEAFSLVSYIVSLGADLNIQDCEGKTALHYAMEKKRLDAVNLLIRRRHPPIKILNNKGRISAYFDKFEVRNGKAQYKITFSFMNELKPDVMQILVDRMTLSRDDLVLILRYNNISGYLWRKRKLHVNMRDSTGKTALHHAVIENDEDGVSFLSKLKANPNVKDEDKKIPLQYITTDTHDSIISVLLRMGIDSHVVHEEMIEKISSLKPDLENKYLSKPRKPWFCGMF